MNRICQAETCYVSIHLYKANQFNQAQMIFTSLDATLMDVNLIRRDSISFARKAWLEWQTSRLPSMFFIVGSENPFSVRFTRKNYSMASEIYSLNDYVKVRNDKSLQKAYLAGLYGAIPMIADEGSE